jgi:hypothetical protein
MCIHFQLQLWIVKNRPKSHFLFTASFPDARNPHQENPLPLAKHLHEENSMVSQDHGFALSFTIYIHDRTNKFKWIWHQAGKKYLAG